MNRGDLSAMREVQGLHGPNMCLASSKFLALKLLGFVERGKHLNDFLHSPWARKHANLPLKSYWGGSMVEYNDAFNKVALPAALNDPSANVRTAGPQVKLLKGFTHFSSPGHADVMLSQRTPLVVGVSIHGGTQRDHFIVIFGDSAGHTWAVDPWPGDDSAAVADLGSSFSFRTRTSVHMTADEKQTTIPCGQPFFGYFQ
ncbi:MAG: hypothetical protein IPL03_11685 [Sterolibacteriaceae bacterium]|nr:hypothetical protein [Candidatus Methylophosphatis haderslevensis]